MVLLGGIERRERLELRHDRLIPQLLRLKLGDHALCRGLLLGTVIEDRRAILRADVGALAVEGGRVVDREEDVEQVFERDDLGIERDLYDLGVAGGSGADVLVRRVGDAPAGIS